MSTYSIYINYGSGWIDITSYVLDGSLAKTETLFDKEAKATINTVTFDLQMTTNIAQTLLELSNSAPVKVRIYKDSSYWFTGYMRPVTEFTVSNSEKIIKIECVDTSWLLSQRKLASTILRMPSDNMVVCRSDGGSTSLVHVLLSAAGWDWGYNVPDILDSVAYYKADKESQTIFDLLCDLLYGFHRNFYIDEEGKFRIYDWGPSNITSAGIFNSNNIIEELKVERDDTEYDSVVAKWYQTTVLSNQMVVNSDPLYGVVTLENYGDKFPSDGAEWWDWSAENTDTKQVIGISNATARYFIHSVRYREGWTPYNVWATGTYTDGSAPRLYLSFPIQHDYEKLRTKFQIYTVTSIDTRVCSFQVFADLVYRIKMADVYYPANGRTNTKELKIDTLYSEAAANALVGAVYKRITIGSRKYRFKSLESANIGGYYTIQNAILNVSQIVRIVEKNTSIYNRQEIYEYYAEGAEAAGSVVTEIIPGVFIPGLPPAVVANITTLSQSDSLLPSGFLTTPIFGSLLENIEDIGQSGLFFTKDYLGFYKWDEGSGTGTWNVRIKSDGTFKFLGDSDNYIEWDGSALLIQGTARSANFVQGSSGWRITVDGNAEFNDVTIRGTVYASEGTIGGWIISTDLLKSAASGARIELNQNKKRVSIFNAIEETVAMGYLEGLPKRDGSGYWGAGDYGFWAKQGDRLRIDGDVEYIKGDWLIQNDASYLIKDYNENILIRLGTKSGEKGLYVLENNTGSDYRAKLDTTGFFIGDDLNYVQYDRASSSLTMKVTSFLVASTGTEIKGTVQISDEGTLGDGLVYPLKLYTSGSGSAKLGVIEQAFGILFKIGDTEQIRIRQNGALAVGDLDIIKMANDGTAFVMNNTMTEEQWGDESIVNNGRTGINRMVLLNDNRILAVYAGDDGYLRQRIRDTNGNWSNATIVVNEFINGYYHALVVLPDGKVLLVYFKSSTLYEKIRDINGSWGPETATSIDNVNDSWELSLANLSDGAVLFVYVNRLNRLAQRIRLSDGSWGSETIINDYSTLDPCLVKLDDGRIVCIYYRFYPRSLCERVRDTNGSWGPETVIMPYPNNPTHHAVLTPDKKILMVYERQTGEPYCLARRIRHANGMWENEVRIASTTDRRYSSLVVTHDNKILLTYLRTATDRYLCQKLLDYSATYSIQLGASQLGAGVIEVGSNSNGTWIKFSDGTMIEYGKINLGTDIPFNYPMLFIATPSVMAGVFSEQGDNGVPPDWMYTVSGNQGSSSHTTFRGKIFTGSALMNFSSAPQGYIQIKWLAIGRWK